MQFSGNGKEEFGSRVGAVGHRSRLLAAAFVEGDTALVDYVDGEFVFGKKEPARKREKVAARAG